MTRSRALTTDGRIKALEFAVVVPVLVTIGLLISAAPRSVAHKQRTIDLAIWVAIIAAVELIPVPMWRSTHISIGFPLLMVVAYLYPPPAAGLVAFLAASDPREFRREVSFLRALFNRCQVALSVLAASATFHAIAYIDSDAVRLFLGASLASGVDYLVNTTIVALGASIIYRMPIRRVIRELRVGRLSEFVVSYLGLAVFALALAKFFHAPHIHFWSVPVLVLPVLLARQMFFRNRALEEAHKELQDREQVLRALSNRMAEERQDEREKIAAYLHDDLAQLLFKLSLQVDIARRHLATGKISETEHTLEEIKDTKARTSDRIRALIRDLHRSPLGRAGLADSLQSFILETARETAVDFHTDVAEIELPPPIALLVYKIAHEGVMNALKHANAQNVWLTVKREGDLVELVLRDDGEGFDTDTPPPEGHFGLTMMRERALVGGGSFDLKSVEGEGTTVTVRFPTSWLQPEPSAPPASAAGNGAGGGPGMAPTPDGEPTRRSALASPR
jgi:signal transduction histidine kinase